MRRKILRITLKLITDMLQTDNEIRVKRIEGLPDDAEVVDIKYNGSRDVDVLIHSDTFEKVDDNGLLPFIECKFERL